MSPSSRSNSRPPLTSRIRASFESKRAKPELTSPVHSNGNHGYSVQDPEALQAAVDQAINSETFQTAIAANLARLIKPSIKDALDTLQPVVEAVYSHEVLLRKTNRSVEDILIRLDTGEKLGRASTETPTPTRSGTPTSPRRRNSNESSNPQDIEQFKQSLEKNNKRTVATLAELSSAVQASNKKINDVAFSIEEIHATLASTREDVDSLRTFVDQSPSTTAGLQAQLSQLGQGIESIGSDLGGMVSEINQKVEEHPSLLASHATKLDAISTDIVALKCQSRVIETIQGLSGDLQALSGKVDSSIASNNDKFSVFETQVGNVLNAVETHSGVLAEIKGANTHPEVLAAIQKSNDSYASHTALLSEIKDNFLVSHSEQASPPAGGDPESTALLQALKADLAEIKENVGARLTSNSDGLTYVRSKVDNILATVEEHKSGDQSADILVAVQKSNDSLTSHLEALEELRSLGGAAPAKNYENNFATLEAQLVSLQTSLQSHASALEDIKVSNVSASKELVPVPEGSGAADIANIVNALHSHSEVLTEIKEDISAEILSTLHDIAKSQTESGVLLSEIKEGDVSDEILTALHSSNDSHASHTTSLEHLHAAVQASNDSHVAHGAAFEELKSYRSADSAGSEEGAIPNALEANIFALTAALGENKTTLAEIKQAANASNESHIAHAASLEELKSARSVEDKVAENVSLEALISQIKTVAATLDEHKATLSNIHEAAKASNDSHTAHTAALAQIKEATKSVAESNSSHGVTLSEIKDATTRGDPAGADIPALEAHLNAIISALETQKAALSDIKNAATNPELLDAVKETYGLVTSNHDVLTINTSLLEAVKAGSSNEDILSNISNLKATIKQSKTDVDAHSTLVKDLHNDTKSSHSELTQAIGALALGGAAGAGTAALASQSDDSTSSEILSQVKAVRALVEISSASIDATKETVTSIASQIDIYHTTVTTSITALSDELKAEIDATGTQITGKVTGLSGAVQAIDAPTLTGIVEGCNTNIKQIAASVETLGGQVQATAGKVDGLADGVHFNGKGLTQLSEHAIIIDKPQPISEAAWFKNPAIPTRGEVTRSGLEDADEEKKHHYLSPVPEEQSPAQEDTPLVDEPVVENVAAVEEEPSPEEPAPEEPVVEPAVGEGDVIPEKEPATKEEPAVEKPIAEEDPAVEKGPVAVEEPAVVEESLAQEEPIAKEPAPVEEPIAEQEPAEVEEEPAVEEERAAVEEPAVMEESSTQEVATAEELTAEEPAAEDPTPEEEESVILGLPTDSTRGSDLDEQPTSGPQSNSETNALDTEDAESESLSAPTSALASPSAPVSPPGSSSGKKGKKGKKEKKEKMEKKTKKEKVQFVMDGDDPEE